MEENKKVTKGKIISADLTISNTQEILEFYKNVVGWGYEELAMEDENGKYSDYVTKDKDGNWVGGICNKRGENNNQPGGWIIYINVENIEKSIEECERLGGKVLKKSQQENGAYNFVLLEDPAGAVFALTQY